MPDHRCACCCCVPYTLNITIEFPTAHPDCSPTTVTGSLVYDSAKGVAFGGCWFGAFNLPCVSPPGSCLPYRDYEFLLCCTHTGAGFGLCSAFQLTVTDVLTGRAQTSLVGSCTCDPIVLNFPNFSMTDCESPTWDQITITQ